MLVLRHNPSGGPPACGSRRAHDSAAVARRGFTMDTVESMDDKEILAHIDQLIQTEHELRSKLAAGEVSGQEEHEQLASAETALDQCWDLLRQRRARREFDQNPEEAQVRPVNEVEGYRQ